MMRQSRGLAEAAQVLIRSSLAAGLGLATSLNCRASGGPYWVQTIAFIAALLDGRFLCHRFRMTDLNGNALFVLDFGKKERSASGFRCIERHDYDPRKRIQSHIAPRPEGISALFQGGALLLASQRYAGINAGSASRGDIAGEKCDASQKSGNGDEGHRIGGSDAEGRREHQ